jgi:hypothetical protein
MQRKKAMLLKKITYFAISLMTIGIANAEGFEMKKTNHFGIVKYKVAKDFHLSAMCTVSGGSSADRAAQLAKLVDFIPHVGDTLAEAMQKSPLEKGEALCGLRHYKGPKPLTRGAKTDGFELDIRTYSSQVLVGGGAPRGACNAFFVNKTSFCFEKIPLKDNNGTEADAVTACIETVRPSDGVTISILVYAGEASAEIVAAAATEAGSIQETSCTNRTY